MRQVRSGGFLSEDWQFFIALQLAIPAVLVLSGVLIPLLAGVPQGNFTLVWVALASALLGILSLFVAKWPLYRQRRYFTFGSKPLPEGRRPLYRIAYVFIAASLFLMLLVLATAR